TTDMAAGPALAELEAKYAEQPDVLRHLGRVREDVLENARLFQPEEMPQPLPMAPPAARPALLQEAALRRYAVNVVVDHSDNTRAPIVYEQHPSLGNLVGRIEHTAQF